MIIFLCNSCTPVRPDGRTRITEVRQLALRYKDNPSGADIAFTGQTVVVLIEGFDRKPGDDPLVLVYQVAYAAKSYPPTVSFRFDPKTPVPADLKAPCWVEGLCRGRVDDGKDRGVEGYTFTVVVTGCRLASPPIGPKP